MAREEVRGPDGQDGGGGDGPGDGANSILEESSAGTGAGGGEGLWEGTGAGPGDGACIFRGPGARVCMGKRGGVGGRGRSTSGVAALLMFKNVGWGACVRMARGSTP